MGRRGGASGSPHANATGAAAAAAGGGVMDVHGHEQHVAQAPAAQPIWRPRDTPTRVISSLDLRRMHDAAVCEGKARVA